MMRKQRELIRCVDCKYAQLMQWWDNPVIAQCTLRDEREVAMSRRLCASYEPSNKPKNIQHLTSYGHGND